MDDHVGLGARHGLRDLVWIERVRDHRNGAQLVEHRLLRLAVRHAMNRMTRGNQARHERTSNRARCTSHKHLHQRLLDRETIHTYDKTATPGRDTPKQSDPRAADRLLADARLPHALTRARPA